VIFIWERSSDLPPPHPLQRNPAQPSSRARQWTFLHVRRYPQLGVGRGSAVIRSGKLAFLGVFVSFAEVRRQNSKPEVKTEIQKWNVGPAAAPRAPASIHEHPRAPTSAHERP